MRRWRLLAVGVLALVLLGALAIRDRLEGSEWHDMNIAAVAISADRQTVWVQAEQYATLSCRDIRVRLARNGDRWEVHFEERVFDEFCTAEGCVGAVSGGQPAFPGEHPEVRMLADDRRPADFACTVGRIDLEEAIPPDVEVVAAA